MPIPEVVWDLARSQMRLVDHVGWSQSGEIYYFCVESNRGIGVIHCPFESYSMADRFRERSAVVLLPDHIDRDEFKIDDGVPGAEVLCTRTIDWPAAQLETDVVTYGDRAVGNERFAGRRGAVSARQFSPSRGDDAYSRRTIELHCTPIRYALGSKCHWRASVGSKYSKMR